MTREFQRIDSALRDWITMKDAMDLIEERTGYRVSHAYLQKLAAKGEIRTKAIHTKAQLYFKADIEKWDTSRLGSAGRPRINPEKLVRPAKYARTPARPKKKDPQASAPDKPPEQSLLFES